jgi:hypothetical protein
MASGKYSQMMDSFAVYRCGKKVFDRTYLHDYATSTGLARNSIQLPV